MILTSYNTRWVGSTILAPKSTLLELLNASVCRPHVILWITFMLIYSVLLGLLPLTWISVIWDQIIDPEFDLEHIEQLEADLDTENHAAWTPLMYAAYHGHGGLVRHLISRKCDPLKTNNKGR